MRKSFFVLPLLAAGLVFACSSAERRSDFEQDKPATDPADSGVKLGNTFQPSGSEGQDAAGGCSSSQTTITRTPVVLEFVVDESGSMQGEKWNAQRDALLAAFDDMKKTADPGLFVGVQLFDTAPTTNVKPKSFTDPDQYDNLTQLVDKPSPHGGSTGTNDALTAGYKVVDKFKPPASGGFDTTNIKRIVVLMSDGAPSGQETEKNTCVQLATDEYDQTPPAGPVLTFAIGVGVFPSSDKTSYDPEFMGNISVAGHTSPAGCDPAATDEASTCHFQVTPGGDVQATKDAFIAALNKIRSLSATCEFKFAITAGADLNAISVTRTGADGKTVKIPKSESNGWSFDDPKTPTKVVLHGDACSASNGTISGRVDVTLGCKATQ